MSSLVDLDDQEFDKDNPPPSKKGKGTAVGTFSERITDCDCLLLF